MYQQSHSPYASQRAYERTVLVQRRSRANRRGALGFLVGALLVLAPVVVWRWRVVRQAAAATSASGVVVHSAKAQLWIDGVRVDAPSIALPCGKYSIRTNAGDAPLVLDVTCRQQRF
jgi:hypothetical protein